MTLKPKLPIVNLGILNASRCVGSQVALILSSYV